MPHQIVTIAHISHIRHNRQWCTFLSWCTLYFRRTQNVGLFWPILTKNGYFVANLRTLCCTFYEP